MTDRAKFEQMLEHLINNDKAKAEEIFHDLVVAKSREIYENLLDDDVQVDEENKETDEDVEEDFDMDLGQEAVGADAADAMIDAVTDPEAEIGDMEQDMGDMDDEEGGEEPATKDDILDIKDALDDLKAEFEAMLAGEKPEEEGEMDFGGDDEGGEKPEDSDDQEKKEDFSFEDSDDIEEGVVREYVEKVTAKMGDSGTNGTRSTLNGSMKNDMGGTTIKTGSGTGSEGGTKGGLLNPATKDLNSGNVNVPGSKTATKMHPTKGHGAEKKGAGEQAANTKSIVGK